MSQNIHCIVCGNNNTKQVDFLVSRKYRLMNCEQCGCSFLDLSGENDDVFEVDEYWDDVNKIIYTQPKVVKELQQKYRFYFSCIPKLANKRHLDVGSGAGICVDTARQFGLDSMGVEPSKSGVELARKTYSINVVNDVLRPDDDLPRNFGLLTLWDVIEHVADPEGLIRTCMDHLDRHGYFILETPDEGAFVRRLVRFVHKIFPVMDFRKSMYYRAHRYYFTQSAMETLLRRCGFDEVEFYKERSMHEKAKMKLDLYFSQDSKISKRIKKIIFWLMRTLPFTKNKMVVVARKA